MHKRLIGVILTDGKNAFLTTRFNQVRRIGSFQSILSRFENYILDEIMILNISQKLNKVVDYSLYEKVIEESQIRTPISVGGGITKGNFKFVFSKLSDRIVLGPKNLLDLELYIEIKEIYGDQSVIFNVPICRINKNDYIIICENRMISISQKTFDKLTSLNYSGEVSLIDVSNQGNLGKFNWEIFNKFSSKNPEFRIILNGGFDSNHLKRASGMEQLTGISSGKFLSTRELSSQIIRSSNLNLFRQVSQYG